MSAWEGNSNKLNTKLQSDVGFQESILLSFYWQITMAEPVLGFSLNYDGTSTSGFLKFNNQITTIVLIKDYRKMKENEIKDWKWSL